MSVGTLLYWLSEYECSGLFVTLYNVAYNLCAEYGFSIMTHDIVAVCTLTNLRI